MTMYLRLLQFLKELDTYRWTAEQDSESDDDIIGHGYY
jgi:hypothetical protein